MNLLQELLPFERVHHTFLMNKELQIYIPRAQSLLWVS